MDRRKELYDRLTSVLLKLEQGPETESVLRLRNELETAITRINESQVEVYEFTLRPSQAVPAWLDDSVVWTEKYDDFNVVYVLARLLTRRWKGDQNLFQAANGVVFLDRVRISDYAINQLGLY